MSIPYDLKKIQSLIKKCQGMNFDKKWTYIGDQFGVSKHAVRKWYYRALEKTKLSKESKITSDQWRTAFLVLTGVSNRDTIPTIKQKIALLCGDEPTEA
jgi:hypothetical protein